MHVHLAPEPEWQRAVNTDRKSAGPVLPGALEVVPTNSQTYASWTGMKHSMRVDIDPARLQRLAGMEFDNESFELRSPELGFVDKQAHLLALWVKQELQNPDIFSAEVLDAFVTVCSAHLLRNYSSLTGKQTQSGGLPPATFRRVKDFIHENSARTCTVEQLAGLAGLSPSHFLRAFKQSAGQSPHQFIIAIRLTHARDLILSHDMAFSLIATTTGFSSHSHMTAQMKRAWGITPSDLRSKR